MDNFHKLLDLIDRNAKNIPEGDYVEICKVIRLLYEKVKPPSYLLDQNEPMTIPVYEPTRYTPPNYEPVLDTMIDIRQLHADWAATD